jgi:hypothetical protein
MKNIHVLPTDKRSILSDCENYKHVYITSDEKFVRDEYVTDGIEIIKATPKLVNAQGLVSRRNWRKIILTTDQDLIADGIQAIDDEFLEWFVENPSCEEIKVELHEVSFLVPDNIYKIIIPQEEPKQETLEEIEKNIDREEWINFFKNNSKEEILEYLINYKFPL